MARRGGRQREVRFDTNPDSVTPWWIPSSGFEKRERKDPRVDSEFFAEFSTESLFTGRQNSDGPTDPYEVLGLFPGASLDQVKRAHRKLAKQYHPDRFATADPAEQREAERRMVQINGAYAELVARVAQD